MPPLTPESPLLRAGEGRARYFMGALGARFLLEEGDTGGGFALLEHPLSPRSIGAPVHTHSREDEWSFVLEGEIGVEIGGRTFRAQEGDLVFKPRGISHAFWNPTDEPARVLELISPAGFERYFDELEPILAAETPDVQALGELFARYGLELDLASMERLATEHGLRVG